VYVGGNVRVGMGVCVGVADGRVGTGVGANVGVRVGAGADVRVGAGADVRVGDGVGDGVSAGVEVWVAVGVYDREMRNELDMLSTVARHNATTRITTPDHAKKCFGRVNNNSTALTIYGCCPLM
jgi:hypothetical protein